MNSLWEVQITQFKNDIFGLDSRRLERDFVNYRKPYGKMQLTKSLNFYQI